jgi:hypothetical protein
MILDTIREQKCLFDVGNEEHLKEFEFFVKNDRWQKSCPFFLEWPYSSIPDMIKDKLVRNMFQC